MSSNHPRQNRKRSRYDSDDDDGPPLKRIKLDPDHDDTCQELKLLSQIMNTIYNHSLTLEDNLYTIQINAVTYALFFTHIIHPEFETPYAGTMVCECEHLISPLFKKFLQEFYGMLAEQFVEKWYTEANIYSIYNQWQQYNKSCMELVNILCHAIDDARKTHKQRIHGSLPQPSFKASVRSELMVIYKNQHNKKMNSTGILATVQLLIADGYIRHNADDLHIPQCISQAVSIYYAPISLKSKITHLLENEVDEMVMNMHTIEQNIFEQLDGLAQVFPLLHDSSAKMIHRKDYSCLTYDSFYTAEWGSVDKIIRGMSDLWNKQYLLDDIGIMEYTKKIETFMEKSDGNYHLEQKAGIGILIPSYNQCILDKHNDDYNTLVMVLSKSELKRIYRVLMRMNSAEGGKLNAAYKHAHCH